MVKKTKPDAKQSKQASAAPKPKAKEKEKMLYDVIFFHKWCKSCGLCSAFCTKKIIKTDDIGLPYIEKMDSCIGCRFCEIHCPDFAITVKERHPDWRRQNGKC
ncbi:MAG TPA: 2-ketoglutarate oxidoreductase subunit delta [Desulfocapsa sulfexigens]|nr:2-ketoglutarate oxidoreductase subunit delta [Desulfocapsa sulfexigens]HIQ36703.1 2-ketoglutarate oxidoreductase subunit delta [Desulfocapsa sulfexigens]